MAGVTIVTAILRLGREQKSSYNICCINLHNCLPYLDAT